MARRLRLAIHHMSAAETRRTLILMVDHDPFVLRLNADALAAEGYEVNTAGNGREALEWIAARSDYSRFLEETAVPVLHKPFKLEDLHRFIRQLL